MAVFALASLAAIVLGLSAIPVASAATCTVTATSTLTGQTLRVFPGASLPAGATSSGAILDALVADGLVAPGVIDLRLATLSATCQPAATSTTSSSTSATSTTTPAPTTSTTSATSTPAPAPAPPATAPAPAPAPPTPTTSTSTSTTRSGSTTTTTRKSTTTTTRTTTSTPTPSPTKTTRTTTSTSPHPTTTTTTSSTTVRPGTPTNERQSTHARPSAGGSSKSTTTRSARHRHRSRTTTGTTPKPTAKLPSGKGVPGTSNPTFSLSLPGAPPVGVPNFFIDSFQIPPFLLPIYQAAGIEYQVPWQILAGINEIETDYGRNLSISSAGAEGWMQFMPATWKRWGVDANGDGIADPYNPVDAIFSAARYLHAAGASTDLSRAIFAYNHATWYVQSVLLRAKLIGGLPSQLVTALTGLVQGHFPVAAPAKYADDSVVSLSRHTVKLTHGNAAQVVESDPNATGTEIFAKRRSPVIAVNDGKIVKLGHSARLGNYVALQDATGNIYTYAHLGTVSRRYAAPKPVKVTAKDIAREMAAPKVTAPKTAASAGMQAAAPTPATAAPTSPATAPNHPTATATATSRATTTGAARRAAHPAATTAAAPLVKERLFAHPARKASYAAGGNLQLKRAGQPITSFDNYFSDVLHLNRDEYTLRRLKVGSIVIAGTILGRIGGPSQNVSPHLYFTIRPAGRNAPNIDPKPILDGWKLLQATAVYRANNIDPFYGPGKRNPSVGQVLLMSKTQLTTRVLTDPHVRVYNCGRRDIQAGTIDRRVLAVIEFLSASGLDPTVSGLACDHSVNGATGVDQAGATGESVDISEINGIPIAGHQGPGSITDIAIRRLLTLQGSMAPDYIVSDMSYKGQSGTLALPDHKNRIQVSYTPAYGINTKLSKQIKAILRPGQWTKLIDRISQIPEPVVPISPSKYAIREPKH